MPDLYHDVPASEGAKNVLKRAKQLMDIRWTPVKPLPSSYKFVGPEGKYFFNAHFSQWLPEKGLPYSSCRMVEKYIPCNVSLETFMTALQNPNSVIYTKSLKDYAVGGVNCYYGIVCSIFVCYALQFPYRDVCLVMPSNPAVKPVDINELESIQLCDIVLDPTRHVAIVTDILRDAHGKIHAIEVSESVMPLPRKTWFNPEEFRKYWLEDGYSIYRYDRIDQVTYEPNPYVYVEGDPILKRPELMLNFGNKANYRIGDEPVEISIFEDGWDELEVTLPNGYKERYSFSDNQLVLNPTEPGYYSARLVSGSRVSRSVEWCMVEIKLSFTKETFKTGEPIGVRFQNRRPEEKVFHCVINDDKYYIKNSYYFTEEEMNTGSGIIPAVKKPGKYIIIVLSKNRFGVYTSHYESIEIV